MIKEAARLCVICGKELKGADAYGSSITHRGECRKTRKAAVLKDAKRRWQRANPGKYRRYRRRSKPKPPAPVRFCVVCNGEIPDTRSIRAITCCNEHGEIHRRSLNKGYQIAQAAQNPKPKRKPILSPGGPLEPRKTRMNKSAVKNTWDNLYATAFFVRPETLCLLKSNRPDVIIELLECPAEVNPRTMRMIAHVGECGKDCWTILIKGKPVTREQQSQWAQDGEKLSYRIREVVT